MSQMIKVYGAVLLAVFFSGCAVSMGFKATETKHEKRMPMRFASAEAARIFYESFFVNENKDKPAKTWSLGFSIGGGVKQVESDNVRLNQAFRDADRNRNGVVSEKEATDYVIRKLESRKIPN